MNSARFPTAKRSRRLSRRWRQSLRKNLFQPHRRILPLELLEPRLPLTAEIEPNDTLATATTLPANQLVEGQVLHVRDIDHFQFALEQGEQFRLQTANTTDALFSPTLPPPVDLLNSSGRVLASTEDGRDLLFTAPASGDYFIRMDSRNVFGTFTEGYSMQTTLSAFTGTQEVEPNDGTGNATALTLGQLFRGALSAADAADFYSVDLNAQDGISVDFAGAGDEAPGIQLLDSLGTLIASATDGQGLSQVVTATGTYFLQVIGNANGTLGEYSGVINRFANAAVHDTPGNLLSDAVDWMFTGRDDRAIGRLDNVQDVDVYRLQIDTLTEMNFTLSPSGNDRLSDQNRVLTLYNGQGQFLAYSTTGTLNTNRTDAVAPGTYYLTVSATGEAGTGSYGLQKRRNDRFANQRDVPTHFIDFDQQMPAHLGYNWVNAFALPGAIPFVTGMFDARYSAYDVDVTTTLPTNASELVTHGYGDFGDIGAGGYGGGSKGERSTSGRAISSARQTSWNSLSYGSIGTLNHEFGHAAGLPHARLPNAFMSYVTTNSVLPVGQGFSFRGTDSRRPGFSIRNERNYLDWSLQAGAQVSAIDSSREQPLNLETYFFEMLGELEPQPAIATDQNPNLIRSGDFNNDGNRDVVVASANANTLETFLGDGAGNFQSGGTLNVNGIGWWTEPITVGDFNGDLRSDVALISYSQNSVSIALGQANGSLGAPANIDLGSGPHSITTSDLNGDTFLDLVTVTWNDQVRVLMGAGDGTFSAPTIYATGDNPYSVTTGDFNGDGRIDVATANNSDNTVSYLFGNGDGTLQAQVALPSTGQLRSITSGDWNGDGLDDLAAVGRETGDTVVYLAQSGGGFASGQEYYSNIDPQTISTGDVNRDGQPDLLVGGFDNHFRILLGQQDGTFTRAVSAISGNSEHSGVADDFTGDGFDDLVVASYWSDQFALFTSLPNESANDAVVVYGEIDSADDLDYYTFEALAGQRFTLDIDSAEFQYPLDASLRLLASDGSEIASNSEALDWNSGLDSLDPFLVHEFANSGTFTIEVSGQWQTAGTYRLKVTPQEAWDATPPRVLAAYPDAGSSINATREITIFFDDQIDPQTLTAGNISVRGATSGIQSGQLRFDPLDSSLVWKANNDLPPDVYTVTIRGGTNGIADTHGNLLDGEMASDFAFPSISGDGQAGGDSQYSFTITATDTAAADVTSLTYGRDPYQRGRLQLRFNDQISWQSVEDQALTLRGAGPDGQFGSADDRILPLDVNIDKVNHFSSRRLDLYTRGVPDPDLYRLEGTIQDAAGHDVLLNESINIGAIVAEAALFQDDALSQPGLVGSYVNQSLRDVDVHDDWRTTQTISGTRVDYAIDFLSNSLGARADVGITGGSDANWDNFSVQWDGWISIPVDGTRLQTRSDDGSRLWIDVNGDGQFASDSSEFWDNGWGTGHPVQAGALTAQLAAGNYRVRLQYEEGSGGNTITLDWLTPDLAGEERGYGHGPSVVGMNVRPSTAYEGDPIDRVAVQFSGAIDPTTLTTNNFQVWVSADATFYDGNDQQLVDADGIIDWNPTTRTATLQPSSPLTVGYFRVELSGDADGVLNTAGLPLDGEFLNSYIPGNTTSPRWSHNPSGDGLPGGDYVATFSIGVVPLSLQLSSDTISELGGQTTATVYRLDPENLTAPLIVRLFAGEPNRISLPTFVTIPAGSDSTSFTIAAIDNDLIEGPVTVEVRATSNGFRDATRTITILDHEQLQLSASPASISEQNGNTQLRISRAGSVGEVVATLTNSNPGKLSVPTQVTIPNGQSFVQVDATGVDNALVDGSVDVLLSVSAVGMIDDSTTVEVRDHEELTVNIAATEIRETAGFAQATVTRTDPSTSLTVQLTSTDLSEATVPPSITIPAGQLTSDPFTVLAVSDGVGDGDQSVRIQAEASGYISAQDSLLVLDDEALDLIIEESSISENGGMTFGRVRRLNTSGDLNVTLSVNDDSSVSFPGSISIPAGSLESGPFTIQAVDNNLLDGNRVVRFVASADQYWPSEAGLFILDYEQLQVAFAGPTTISEQDGETSITVTRSDSVGELIVDLSVSDRSELAVPHQITIPDGSLTSAPIMVSAVDDDLLDGTQTVNIVASADAYVSQSVEVQVEDLEQLDATLESTELSENGGELSVTVHRLNSNPRWELSVAITYSDASELSGPSEVLFEPFVTSKTFTVVGVDDTLLDGTQIASFTVTSPGYATIERSVSVLDYEELSLSLQDVQISEFEGITTATVSRPQAEPSDLTVQLQVSDATELSVPSSVTIPAGADSVSFEVMALDDSELDGDVPVQILASAPNYVVTQIETLVTDYESLAISFAEPSISERQSNTRATISLPGITNRPLFLSLVAQPSGDLIVPATVRVPAGESSVEFSLIPVYDPEPTGTKQIEVVVSHEDYTSGADALQLIDVDPLIVSIDTEQISESNGMANLTITRGGQLTETTIEVIADLAGQLSFPSQVTIPEGAASVVVPVQAIDNDLLDGTRQIALTASGGTFVPGIANIAIADAEQLTLSLATQEVDEDAGSLMAFVTRSNQDNLAALTVDLMSDSDGVVEFPAQVTIPAGQVETSFEIVVLDDPLVEPDRTFEISASAAGYESAMDNLTVRDNDLYSWTNQVNRFDVNNDGFVSPVDALLVIVELNSTGGRPLPPPTTDPGTYYDVSEDEFLSPIDALMVINELNLNSGQGEADSLELLEELQSLDWIQDRKKREQRSAIVDDFFANGGFELR